MTETTPAREAESAWLSVQQAHTVGDPHGFAHHAARLTAALAALSPPAISKAVEAEREACARIAANWNLHPVTGSPHETSLNIATAIRTRTSISEVVG